MAKHDRKRFAERLLRERLGLDEDWLNRDDNGNAHLPSALPQFPPQRLPRPALKALEEGLDRLVEAGCRRQTLYFCLAQLNSEADWSGKQLVATKEDMEAVANKAKAARKLIHRYRSELLLAASASPQGLPGGMFITLRDPDEVISVLMNSLTWVSSLADSYAAPFEKTLLKSKGLLYLTLYVSLHADARCSRVPNSQRKIGTPVVQRPVRRSKMNPTTHGLTVSKLPSRFMSLRTTNGVAKLLLAEQHQIPLIAPIHSKLSQTTQVIINLPDCRL